MRKLTASSFAACLVLLAGCDREATGQVAAVVNGEEITLQELNAEIEAVPVSEGADQKALQQAALQRVIERRLLAQEARKDGLDKSPEFLARKRQVEEAVLVQMLARGVERGSQVPAETAINDYIASNPALFGDRTIYTLDRIQFAIPSDPERLRQLEDAHSMDAVATKLRELGIEFARGPGQMDSAQVGQERLNRILALPNGEPFIFPEGGAVTVAVITGQTEQPISGDQARPIAVQAMRNKNVTEALQQRLNSAKAAAEIDYQADFAPRQAAVANSSTPAKR